MKSQFTSSFIEKHYYVERFSCFLELILVLTISIDVHSTGVSLSVVVCVCLVWVTVVRAVVAAVTHIIAVIIVLPGVVDEWTVVLFQKGERQRGGKRVVICFLSVSGSILQGWSDAE